MGVQGALFDDAALVHPPEKGVDGAVAVDEHGWQINFSCIELLAVHMATSTFQSPVL